MLRRASRAEQTDLGPADSIYYDELKLPSGGLRLNASKSESRLEATMHLVLGAIDGMTTGLRVLIVPCVLTFGTGVEASVPVSSILCRKAGR